MQGHKTAKAAPSFTGASPAGLLFSGWSREGYWSEGTLLRGKAGRTVNLTKFLGHRPQEALRATLAQVVYAPPVESLERVLERLNAEIPVFMESHL